ncbi:MAG: hypothetical protein H7122_17075 [Chitinophagaceae bacterium]|nr:hypothetical protein [Chitinophagaceae bacterium]
MKKKFSYRAAIIIQIMLVASIGYSQKQSADPTFNSKMKIGAPDSSVSPATGSAYSTDLSSLSGKVLKNFKKNFRDVSDLRINTFENHTYVYCITNGIINRIRYDKRGNWNYTIRYYEEKLLPQEIRKQVRVHFLDFEISGVTEVTVGDKTAYLVRIQSVDTWKTVKIIEDEMTIVESFRGR